jgi:hypothetical protein
MELVLVHRDTSVENRVELVAVCSAEVQPRELVHLGIGAHLISVERRFEIVELVRIRLVAQDINALRSPQTEIGGQIPADARRAGTASPRSLESDVVASDPAGSEPEH